MTRTITGMTGALAIAQSKTASYASKAYLYQSFYPMYVDATLG